MVESNSEHASYGKPSGQLPEAITKFGKWGYLPSERFLTSAGYIRLLLERNFSVRAGCVAEIQAQFDSVHQKILSSLLKIRESYNHDQERLSELERDLKLNFENVRQCAIDYFIKGEYLQCERLLSFLTKVLPHDEDLEEFLELSHRKQVENGREKTRSAIEG